MLKFDSTLLKMYKKYYTYIVLFYAQRVYDGVYYRQIQSFEC